jgi:hypothetical protein
MVKFAFVEAKNAELPKPPIGFFVSLWKGLEAVNSFPVLLLIPILLDLFLWLGPHFSLAPWFQAMMELSNRLQQLMNAKPAQDINAADITQAVNLFQQFNLASALSTWGLFPPSLMAAIRPVDNPMGIPFNIPMASTIQVLETWVVFFSISLLLGGLYWALAGLAVAPQARTWRRLYDSWGRMLGLLMLGGLIVGGGIVFAGIPILYLISLASLLLSAVSFLSVCIPLIVTWFFLWIVLMVAFAPHDCVLYSGNPFRAVLRSIECVRVQYPSAMLPLLFWGGLLWVMLFIWAIPPANSWLSMIGIVGCAYTSSIIVTASLAYYQDRRRWLEETKAFLAARRVEQAVAASTKRG